MLQAKTILKGNAINKSFLSNALLKFSSLALAFILNCVYIRILGLGGFGRYSFFLDIALLTSSGCVLGFPQFITKEIAKGREEPHARALTTWVYNCAFRLYLVSIIPLGIGLWMSGNIRLFAVLPFVLCIVLEQLAFAESNGSGRLTRALFLELVFRLLIPCVIGAVLYLSRLTVRPNAILAITISLFLPFYFFLARLNGGVLCPFRLKIPELSRADAVAIAQFSILALVLIANQRVIPVLIGSLLPPESYAQFKVANTLSALITVLLGTYTLTQGPMVARAHATGDAAGITAAVKKGYLENLIIGGSVFFAVILGGRFMLSRVYSITDPTGYYLLLIFSVGQLVSLACGPVAMVLNNTDNQRLTIKAQISSFVAKCALIPAGIALIGVMGAGIAVTAGISLLNIMNLLSVRKTFLAKGDGS